MWEMVYKKTRKLIPLFNFVCTIAASPPLTQLQFFLEPLAFPYVTGLCSIYGQTVLNTVYYCIRTYVYYIHREKEIFLGKWRGDMTVVTLKSSKVMTFKIPTRQQRVSNLVTSNTNDISVPGDTDPPTGFDCHGGAVRCTCGGKVVGACKSGWYCDKYWSIGQRLILVVERSRYFAI